MKLARMNNILIAVAIAAVLIASVNLPGSVLAAGTAVVSVSAPTQAVSSGTQFTVSITVQPNNAIAGAQFNLSFNPALVSVNSVTEGNLFNQGGASTYFTPGTINNTTGTVTGVADAITNPGKTISAMGTFAVITMTAGTYKGTSTLTLSNVIVGDINGQSMNVNVVNGQVVISGGATTTTPPPTGGSGTTTAPPPTTGSGGGGGGGAAITGPTSVAGVTYVASAVNSQGIFNQDVNAWSDDNNILMHIPTGTASLNSDGTPLTQISIVNMTTPPTFQTGAGMITLAYDFTPPGATFNPPATIRFSYDPTLIPAGVAESSLQIAYYDSSAKVWITLPSTVDTSSHFIYAQIAHFTPYTITYGVKAVTPPPMTTITPAITTTIPTVTNTVATSMTTTTTSTTPAPTTPTTTVAVSTAPTPTTATSMMPITKLPTASINPPSANILIVKMGLLASVIGVAIFLVTFTATFIWLRHRDLLKKGSRLN